MAAIQTVNELVDEGRELGQLVNDFTWYMRNLLLMQSSDEMEEVLDMSADNLAALKEEARMVSPRYWFGISAFFRVEQSDQICSTETYPVGSGHYQTLSSTDGSGLFLVAGTNG